MRNVAAWLLLSILENAVLFTEYMERTSGWTRRRMHRGMSKGMVEQGEAELRGRNGGGTLKKEPAAREHRCSTVLSGPDACLTGARVFGTRSLCDTIQGSVKKKKLSAPARPVITVRYSSDIASQNSGKKDKLGLPPTPLYYI